MKKTNKIIFGLLLFLFAITLVGCKKGSDKKAVDKEIEKLAITFADGDSMKSVTKNVQLYKSKDEKVTIEWKSNNAAITKDGKVTRQQKDIIVTLTAIVKSGKETASKIFKLTVIKSAEVVDQTVNNLIAEINALAYEFTDEFKTKLDAAKKKYDELSDDKKAKISNKKILTDLATKYASDLAEKTKIQNVIGAIADLTYEFTDEFKNKLDNVMNLFGGLTDEQKEKVSNKDTLEQLISKYDAAVVADENAKVKAVEDEINALVYQFTPAFQSKLNKAEQNYKKLPKPLQQRVSNSAKLEKLIAQYATDLANETEGSKLKKEIDKLVFDYNETFHKKITDMKTKYDGLSAAEKAKVDNIAVLNKHIADYNEIANSTAITIDQITKLTVANDTKYKVTGYIAKVTYLGAITIIALTDGTNTIINRNINKLEVSNLEGSLIEIVGATIEIKNGKRTVVGGWAADISRPDIMPILPATVTSEALPSENGIKFIKLTIPAIAGKQAVIMENDKRFVVGEDNTLKYKVVAPYTLTLIYENLVTEISLGKVDFEEPNFKASTSYNNTSFKSIGKVPGKKWKLLEGAVSGSSKSALDGKLSVQFRDYTTNSVLGKLKTDFKMNKLTKVKFLAAAMNSYNLSVSYSLDDGTTWLNEQTVTLTTKSKGYEYVLKAGEAVDGAMIRFSVIAPETPKHKSKIYIDNVEFFGVE